MKRRFTEDSWRKEPWFRSLATVLTGIKTEEDMANFLRDIATLSELQAMSERLEVARLLSRGYSYRQVAKATGASTTTVTRVAHFLENGEGGYRKVLKVHRHHRMIQAPETLPGPKGAFEPNLQEKPAPLESFRAQEEGKKSVSPLQKYLERK